MRARVLRAANYECAIRGPRCTRIATEVDHIWPVVHGGALYDRNNLQAACFTCNRAKSDRLPTATPPVQSRPW